MSLGHCAILVSVQLGFDGDSFGSGGHKLGFEGGNLSLQLGSDGDCLSSGSYDQYSMGTMVGAMNRGLDKDSPNAG